MVICVTADSFILAFEETQSAHLPLGLRDGIFMLKPKCNVCARFW